uniref:Uncharacterized protein n=1 Tax=Polytomella parva TaxID=51329 RepID=A0A7S0YMJ2_9CHLO
MKSNYRSLDRLVALPLIEKFLPPHAFLNQFAIHLSLDSSRYYHHGSSSNNRGRDQSRGPRRDSPNSFPRRHPHPNDDSFTSAQSQRTSADWTPKASPSDPPNKLRSSKHWGNSSMFNSEEEFDGYYLKRDQTGSAKDDSFVAPSKSELDLYRTILRNPYEDSDPEFSLRDEHRDARRQAAAWRANESDFKGAEEAGGKRVAKETVRTREMEAQEETPDHVYYASQDHYVQRRAFDHLLKSSTDIEILRKGNSECVSGGEENLNDAENRLSLAGTKSDDELRNPPRTSDHRKPCHPANESGIFVDPTDLVSSSPSPSASTPFPPSPKPLPFSSAALHRQLSPEAPSPLFTGAAAAAHRHVRDPFEEQDLYPQTVGQRMFTSRFLTKLNAVLNASMSLRAALTERFGFQIRGVRMASDRKSATVLWTCISGQESACEAALKAQGKKLQSAAGRALNSQHIPILSFILDRVNRQQAVARALVEQMTRERDWEGTVDAEPYDMKRSVEEEYVRRKGGKRGL